jgi:hypothetical protein
VALALVIAGIILQWRRGNLSAGIDFYQFWLGGQAVREHGLSNLYSAEAAEALAAHGAERAAQPDAGERLRLVTKLRSHVEIFSTPFLYSAFALFGRDYETSYQLDRAITLLALCIAVLLFGRSAGLPLLWSLALLAFILFLYQPLQAEVRVANVNAMQLLMLAAGSSLLTDHDGTRFEVASGAVFGLAAAFKPNVALIVPLLFILMGMTRGRASAVRFGGGGLLGAGSAIALSSLLFRSWRCWFQWRTAAGRLASTILPRSSGNVAVLLPLIARYGPVVTAAAAAVLLALTLAAMARGRQGSGIDGSSGIEGSSGAQLVAGAAVLIYLMTAGLVWLHYLLLALPAVMALLGTGDIRHSNADPARRLATLIALSALAIDPWALILRLPRSTVAPPSVTIGIALLFILSIARLGRREA